MFFSHNRRRRNAILAAVLRFRMYKSLVVETQSHTTSKSSTISIQSIFHVIDRVQREKCIQYNLHKETMCFSFTTGDDRIPRCVSIAAILAAVLRCRMQKSLLAEHFSNKSSTFPLQYIFHHISCHDLITTGHMHSVKFT